ncbi:HisG-domain-containing protein [Tothia fuscella]|uniref:ATP phosphoribosyltransferase n=1 Tax=Tothia fuscella TaxID=1048955 RepID=A0A9P4U1X5_9PEZI|nr:HisG-domain-containing protein [Tothia fuscella]
MDLVNSLNDRLLFAVPKKGRLHQACLDLLQGSDIQFHRHSRLDIALVKNFPLALVFLPAADIPTFVGEGRVDLGITGRDQVAEHDAVTPPTETTGVEEILDLEFGRCKLQVQVPDKGPITRPEELVGKNIVTSFVNLASRYFADLEAGDDGAVTNGAGAKPSKTTIKYVGGSVEAACALGVADGIVDLVESGETMRVAGLKAISTVVESTAILIKSKHPSDPKLVKYIDLIANRIRGVITAQKYVLCTYNIERTKMDAARDITPGKRAPTMSSLEEEGWVAVSVMVPKRDIGNVMDRLEAEGAEDILVTKLENSRTSPETRGSGSRTPPSRG